MFNRKKRYSDYTLLLLMLGQSDMFFEVQKQQLIVSDTPEFDNRIRVYFSSDGKFQTMVLE